MVRFVLFLSIILFSESAKAFWVVNFGTASTLAPRRIGFAAGKGGQLVVVGEPRRTNAFFMIPHAGFRLGLYNRVDCGLRLAPVPLPYASVGPGFGMNLDVKIMLSAKENSTRFAIVIGAGGAHVMLQEHHRTAYSPNFAFLSSFRIKETTEFTLMARYVNLGIPTAAGGARNNKVDIAGVSAGLKKQIAEHINLFPEIGVYWYEGMLGGNRTSGPGFQYGLMLAVSF